MSLKDEVDACLHAGTSEAKYQHARQLANDWYQRAGKHPFHACTKLEPVGEWRWIPPDPESKVGDEGTCELPQQVFDLLESTQRRPCVFASWQEAVAGAKVAAAMSILAGWATPEREEEDE